MDPLNMKYLIIASGLGHLALGLGSLYVPKALRWNSHLKLLPVLLRQIFWTYAGYILAFNFFFGTVSLIATDDLIAKSVLASSITFFISIYWLARIFIQFFYFDKTDAPKGLLYTLGEVCLVVLFISFAAVYFAAFLYNNSWI